MGLTCMMWQGLTLVRGYEINMNERIGINKVNMNEMIAHDQK